MTLERIAHDMSEVIAVIVMVHVLRSFVLLSRELVAAYARERRR